MSDLTLCGAFEYEKRHFDGIACMAVAFAKLTRIAIRRLAVGETIEEHNIKVQRMRSGDLRYSVAAMVDGIRINRVVGYERDGVTREQAERFLETVRVRAREDRLDLPNGRKLHRSFAEAAKEYLTRMEQAGGKNLRTKRRHMGMLFIPRFGAYRASKVTALMIEDYVVWRLRLVSQATVNRELATLSHALKRWVEWGWIKGDDAPRIRKGVEPRKQMVVLDSAAIEVLMKAAESDADPRMVLFVAFGLNTAMRHSEILRVRYCDLDLPNRRIFIPRAKAGEREQPITTALANQIKAQWQRDGEGAEWLFPATRRTSLKPNRSSLAAGFRRTVERAGLVAAKVTPHVMRHTAITRLVKAGVDLPTIQRISGHKTLSMVLRYVHLNGSHIDKAIDVLSLGPTGATTHDLHTKAEGAAKRQPALV